MSQLQDKIKAEACAFRAAAEKTLCVIATQGVVWNGATDQEIFAIATSGAIVDLRAAIEALEMTARGLTNMVTLAELRRDEIRARMREKCIKA